MVKKWPGETGGICIQVAVCGVYCLLVCYAVSIEQGNVGEDFLFHI